MKATRKISRRSFLGSIGGGAAAAGALLTLTGCATLGYSDSDPYDPIGGGGRGGGRRGGGRGEGRGDGGRGRGGRGGEGGCSDSDSGRNADPSGRGRRCR
jgi:hypothetical protein